MDNTQSPHHSHVMFSDTMSTSTFTSFNGPCVLLHSTTGFVWVPADASDDMPEGAVLLAANGETFDDQGTCIAAIPRSYVKGWLTCEEAATIEQCMDADERLLSYAR